MESKEYKIIHDVKSLKLHIPDKCPICHHGIKPSTMFGYEFEREFNKHIRIVFICPRKECQEMYIGLYYKSGFEIHDRTPPDFRGCWPFTFQDEVFVGAVKEISPSFVTIYNQAKNAEERGLGEICGLGYRKALEFLIKDFLILTYPEESESIKNNHKFDSVIEKYVSDEKVKFLAKRAAWLGNDHAHYTKKWEDKDLSDLKRLINTTVYWIAAEKELDHYRLEMAERKK